MTQKFNRWFDEKVILENRVSIVVVMTTFILSSYFLAAYPIFFAQSLLPLTWLDRFPIHVDTIWIYVSEYPLLIFSVAFVKDDDFLRRLVRGAIFIQVVAILVFLFYPTTYPREMFPLPTEDSWSKWALEIVRGIDRPSNCMPSLHVADCAWVSIVHWEKRRKLCLGLGFWTVLIAISTMTTKQHYLIDVITGFSLASWAYVRYFRKT